MNEQQKARLNKIVEQVRGAKILDATQAGFRGDGYTNLLNKYGTAQDNSTAYYYEKDNIVIDIELTSLYESNGIFAKIIDRPSEESLKHGLDIDFGDETISEYVEERLDDLDFEDKFATAEKWARLYGGAIIVMLCDDGGALEEPLDWDKVTTIEELRVFDRSVVQEDFTGYFRFNVFGATGKPIPQEEPMYYRVSSTYGYFVVHSSRCLVFRNGRLPEKSSSTLFKNWGMPEYIRIREALRECLTTHANGTKLLERSVQAIYKMQNLANLLSSEDGEEKVLQRLQVIDMARGILNSIAIDASGEDYDFKTLPMSGVKDIIDTTCNMLSAVTNIPQTILFGRSPAGMNATGDSDLENYYNMVENIQKQNMKKNVRTLLRLILKQGFLEGAIPEIPRFKVKFAALWSQSDTEIADIEQRRAQTQQIKAQTAQSYIETGVLDPSEVRKSLAEEGEFDIEEILTEDDIDLPEDTFAPVEEPDKPDNDMQIDSDSEAAAVIVIHDGKVLCARRIDTNELCGPGGHIEEGESPEETALREAQEEFDIVPLNIIPLGRFEASSEAYCNSTVYFTDQYIGTPKADGAEMYNEQWLSLEELKGEKLFPPFLESIDMLEDFLKNYLTKESGEVTVRITEQDGGPGSGIKGHTTPKPSKELIETANEYSKAIEGLVAVNGVVMKSVSIHAAQRIKERKTSIEEVKEVLTKSGISYPGNKQGTKCIQGGGWRLVTTDDGKLITAVDLLS